MNEETSRSVKREFYRELLLKFSEDVKRGKARNIAFVGQHGIGKSLILKDFLSSEEDAAYVDFCRIGLSPEDFAVSFISAVGSQILKRDAALDECGVNEGTKEIVAAVKNELLKVKPDHKLLVESAFRYCERLDKKPVLLLDEFWKILALDNFSAVSDVISIVKKFELGFVITGSAVFATKNIAKELGFEVVEVLPWKLNEVGDDEVHHYSFGVPAYVNAIKSRKDKFSAREAFLVECLWKNGVLYNSCRTRLEEGLGRARGKALLLSILRVLTFHDGMRLSEVSRGIYRSSAVTKNLVERLIEVDLIVKNGNRYDFSDPILKFWLKQYILGVEFDFMPDKTMLKKIKVDL